MKNTALLSLLTLWAALPTSTAFAQKDAVSAGESSPVSPQVVTPTLPSPTVKEGIEGITVILLPQSPPTTVPEAAIVPGVSIQLEGRGQNSPTVRGFQIDVHGDAGGIDGFVPLEEGRPIGPIQRTFKSLIISESFIYEARTFTIGVLTKPSLAEHAGNSFAIRILGIVTDAPVRGSLPVGGASHTYTRSLQHGRMTIASGTVGPQQLTPLVAQQLVGGFTLEADSVERQQLAILTIDLHTDGGYPNDLWVGLYRPDGKLMAATWGEGSVLFGQGVAKFYAPLEAEKGVATEYYARVRAGYSWRNGGTLSLSASPSKSIARGELYGYGTVLAPRTVIPGPIVRFSPVAYGEYQAFQVATPNQLPSGSNRIDLARVAINAPGNKNLVVPNLGAMLAWIPVTDRIQNVGFYAYEDGELKKPVLGVQPDGAFARGADIQQFTPVTFDAQDPTGLETAVVVPAGKTYYFVLRGTHVSPPSPGNFAVVAAGIFHPADQNTIALHYLSR